MVYITFNVQLCNWLLSLMVLVNKVPVAGAFKDVICSIPDLVTIHLICRGHLVVI